MNSRSDDQVGDFLENFFWLMVGIWAYTFSTIAVLFDLPALIKCKADGHDPEQRVSSWVQVRGGKRINSYSTYCKRCDNKL